MYDSIYLEPKYSIVLSRLHCDTSVTFGGNTFNLPIIPSNMVSTINIPLAKELAKREYFYILHRFMNYNTILDFVKEMREHSYSSISIGVKGRDYELVKQLSEQNLQPDYITIDIAHGHSILMKSMVKYVKLKLPESFLIAGNVGSVGGVNFLETLGVNCIKVGLGNGGSCLTKNNTGFYSHPVSLLPQLTHCNIPIIADGGIKEHGDITKALVLGADLVMIGGMLAGFQENSTDIFAKDNKHYTLYSGSTANNTKHVEGKHIEVEVKGSILNEYERIKQNLQSSISYAGGDCLRDLRFVDYFFQ